MAELAPFLVFLPGLGADWRVFARQTAFFENSLVVEWLPSPDGESVAEYADRLAEAYRDRVTAPCVVCGLSFGGILAPLVARRWNAIGCVLIASMRRPSQFPRRYRWALKAISAVPGGFHAAVVMMKLAVCGAWPVAKLVAGGETVSLLDQFRALPVAWLRRSLRMMLDWSESPESDGESGVNAGSVSPTMSTGKRVPVRAIHGDRDRVIPLRGLESDRPDHVIAGAGHIPTGRFASELNAAILDVMDSFGRVA